MVLNFFFACGWLLSQVVAIPLGNHFLKPSYATAPSIYEVTLLLLYNKAITRSVKNDT